MTAAYQPGYDFLTDEWDRKALPNWDADRAFGEAGEQMARDIFWLIQHEPQSVEVKREKRANGRHFVETKQKPRGCLDYQPSALAITTARLWVVIFPNDSMLVVQVATLRNLWQRGLLGVEVDGGADGDNPTRGHVVSVDLLSRKGVAS